MEEMQEEEMEREVQLERAEQKRVAKRYARILVQLHRLADTVEVNTIVLLITQIIIIYLALRGK